MSALFIEQLIAVGLALVLSLVSARSIYIAKKKSKLLVFWQSVGSLVVGLVFLTVVGSKILGARVSPEAQYVVLIVALANMVAGIAGKIKTNGANGNGHKV
jgi:hypothetical protein